MNILFVIDDIGCKLRCAAVGKVGNDNTNACAAGVDHLAAADIHGYVAGIEDQITGLCLGYADPLTVGSLSACTGDLVTEMFVDPHGEAGAVSSVGQ